jgi:UTP--glucose-1-phosphate uridylyltransferase
MSYKKLKTVIFPAAGLGTRFLPVTKANPKEMLPIVDKPLIQYAVEEAIEAGFEQLVFVISPDKNAIRNHFESTSELDEKLKIEAIIPTNVSSIYIEQSAPLGLGHAIWCARDTIEAGPFAVVLPDDLIDGAAAGGCLLQMVRHYEKNGCGAIGIQKIALEETKQYGIIEYEDEVGGSNRIASIVEKPDPQFAPSLLGVVGRYILPSAVMGQLEKTQKGSGNEIQLTDGISALLGDYRIDGFQFKGQRYDCGSKIGYLKANVDYALKHPELAQEFTAWLTTKQ